jgi:hypothetical protein
LRTVADAGGDVGEQDGTGVGEARGEGLLLHEVGEDAGIAGEAGQRDAVVGVDGDDFALVGGEFFCVALNITTHVSQVYMWFGMGKIGILLARRGRRGFC